jgi:hypothetical protein
VGRRGKAHDAAGAVRGLYLVTAGNLELVAGLGRDRAALVRVDPLEPPLGDRPLERGPPSEVRGDPGRERRRRGRPRRRRAIVGEGDPAAARVGIRGVDLVVAQARVAAALGIEPARDEKADAQTTTG